MDKDILARFFRGQCDEHEVRKVMAWLHSEKADEYFSDELLDLWAEFSQNEGEQSPLGESIVRKVNDNLFGQKIRKTGKIYEKQSTGNRKWLFRIAATVAILAVTFSAYFFSNSRRLPSEEKIAFVVKNQAAE